MKFVTAILENHQVQSRADRFQLLDTILSNSDGDTDVLVLPAGFVSYELLHRFQIYRIDRKVSSIIKKHNRNVTVCFGADFGSAKHQLSFAINQTGIIAIGRKFFPTKPDKKNGIQSAKSPNELEFGYKRTFQLKGKNLFLAVCYDVYGIRDQTDVIMDIDYIINLVHEFNPKGDANSGDNYFARLGFAGASKAYNCPVLASTVFIDRPIPERWPSGVVWQSGDQKTRTWKYEHNGTQPSKTERIEDNKESAELRYFEL